MSSAIVKNMSIENEDLRTRLVEVERKLTLLDPQSDYAKQIIELNVSLPKLTKDVGTWSSRAATLGLIRDAVLPFFATVAAVLVTVFTFLSTDQKKTDAEQSLDGAKKQLELTTKDLNSAKDDLTRVTTEAKLELTKKRSTEYHNLFQLGLNKETSLTERMGALAAVCGQSDDPELACAARRAARILATPCQSRCKKMGDQSCHDECRQLRCVAGTGETTDDCKPGEIVCALPCPVATPSR